MATFRQFVARLRAFFHGGELDNDFAQEMEAHLEMATEENIRNGMTRDDARRQASVRLGGATSLQSQHRDARGFRVLEDLFQDLRFASRLMIKDRWFTAAAIAVVALGIGANTVGFTIINAAFIRGFSFEASDRLYAISWQAGDRRRTASIVELDEWRAQAPA